MNIKKCLGAKIRHLRKKYKYSQEYFAELVDINPRQIVRIENGISMPTVENLEKIANALNTTVEELFINDSYNDTKFLKEKIHNITEELPDEKLRILYLIASNL